MDLLRNIDVLVDGPFVEQLRDEQLRFRGSANQRILDSEQIASQMGQVL
jgi:anaerobic ribonucleoside-triphosphate reductase activating protein